MGDCRFCGTSEGVKINIFDSVGEHVSKIETILPLQMRASEPMPKVMCHRCMHKINEFYDFRRKCLSLDLKWRARLITLESNSTNLAVFPVTIKLEPPDPDDSPVEITNNISKTENAGWSSTSESNLPNNGAAVIILEKQDKQKSTPEVVNIEEDEKSVTCSLIDDIKIQKPLHTEDKTFKTPGSHTLEGKHFPKRLPPTAKKLRPFKRCMVCHKKGIRKESNMCCHECGDVPLCLYPCFEVYHSRKSEDPLQAAPQDNTTDNKDATSPVSKRGKTHHRSKSSLSPPKELKRKRNEKKIDIKPEKKDDIKNDKKNDKKKSVPRTNVTSAVSPENTTLTTSSVKPPLQVSLNQDLQKLPLPKNPLSEKTVKAPKLQKLKLNLIESASLSSQTSSKEPLNVTATKTKLCPEQQTPTFAVKIGPRNHQKVTSVEPPKPPTESEKPLPPHIIMTSIPNVCTIFTCSLCERTFTSRSLACCHNDCVKIKNNSSFIENEGGSAEGIYACSHCGMKFTRYASLVPHEETHILNDVAEDSDTLSSSSDEETSRKRKKKRSSPVQIDSVKNIANAFT